MPRLGRHLQRATSLSRWLVAGQFNEQRRWSACVAIVTFGEAPDLKWSRFGPPIAQKVRFRSRRHGTIGLSALSENRQAKATFRAAEPCQIHAIPDAQPACAVLQTDLPERKTSPFLGDADKFAENCAIRILPQSYMSTASYKPQHREPKGGPDIERGLPGHRVTGCTLI